MKNGSQPKLAYQAPERSESGMVLQLLELDQPAPFKSSRFMIEPGGSSPTDNHSVAEMWVVVQGSGELLYDGSLVQLTAGDAVYFEPFHSHQIKNNSTEALKLLSFWWPQE